MLALTVETPFILSQNFTNLLKIHVFSFLHVRVPLFSILDYILFSGDSITNAHGHGTRVFTLNHYLIIYDSIFSKPLSCLNILNLIQLVLCLRITEEGRYPCHLWTPLVCVLVWRSFRLIRVFKLCV